MFVPLPMPVGQTSPGALVNTIVIEQSISDIIIIDLADYKLSNTMTMES